ncbi:MAG: hypothetical protein IJN72_06975 [Firmicutes bacterium]|nr:hypothetical protein [Bacillota bacterium]
MFIEQRKKKNYRTFIYAAIIVVLCLIIVIIAWPQNSDQPSSAGNQDIHEQSQNVTEPENKDVYNPGDFIGRFGENNQDEDEIGQQDEEKPDIAQAGATYYLVRRDGSEIKVFFIDESGNQVELETTEIIYDVLGPDDQKLFDEGYRVDTQEQLAVLLQDFES